MPRRRAGELVPHPEVALQAGKCIDAAVLAGCVLALVRQSLGVSQHAIATHLGWPDSMISKLELAAISLATYHLDALAAAFTHFAQQDAPTAPVWRGWHLHRLVSDIADALGRRGFAVMWSPPQAVERRRLLVLARECWPHEHRR